jgi:hypothetical protein
MILISLQQSARKLARDGLNPAVVDFTSTSRVKDKAHIIAMIDDTKQVSAIFDYFVIGEDAVFDLPTTPFRFC